MCIETRERGSGPFDIPPPRRTAGNLPPEGDAGKDPSEFFAVTGKIPIEKMQLAMMLIYRPVACKLPIF